MIRVFGPILVLLLLSTNASSQDDYGALVKENCSAKWQSDYEMIKYCIDEEYEAWDNVADLLAKYPEGTEERNIVARCAAKWPGERGGYDFRMVEYCSGNQLRAYRALR